jgi:hypothetical protein
MMHRTLSVVVALMLAVPAFTAAQRDEPDDLPKAKEKDKKAEPGPLEEIQKSLKQIQDDISDLRQRRDTDQKARAIEMEDLDRRLSKLEKSVDRLERGQTRYSSYFNPDGVGMGTIRLQNRSSVGVTVLMAGKSYRVPAQETVVLEGRPAGAFTYEVLAEGYGMIQPTVSRTLREGEMFSIFINP